MKLFRLRGRQPSASLFEAPQKFVVLSGGGPIFVPLTARQALTDSLMRDETLAAEPDHVETLVKGILLDLNEAGLTIVASGDVE
ncbi:hypothetical protein [Streptosporangium sp. NPDC002721]|uniref:hypothetical protein n=1 Tax=Streptosporangium sp. NPDC002721 TaxID=3366188 RepID=UPI0036B0EFF7